MFENPVLLLIAGLLLLLTGGEFLVRGGVSLAANFKISTLVVGVTVVSLGTSAPELVVSAEAALSGHPDIAMGNVLGSNIANIGLVLGLTILITPVFTDTGKLLFNMLVMLAVTILLYALIADRFYRDPRDSYSYSCWWHLYGIQYAGRESASGTEWVMYPKKGTHSSYRF
jgi:Ca2+/Na+ antiporter